MTDSKRFLVGFSAQTSADLEKIKGLLLSKLKARNNPEPMVFPVTDSFDNSHNFRFCGYFDSRHNLIQALEKHTPKDLSLERLSSRRKTVWMYPGSGVQYPGMGKNMYHSSVVFRDAVDLCAAQIEELDGFDPRQLYHASIGEREIADFALSPSRAGMAVFVYQYAMTELFKSLGFIPDIVVGHSLGEYAAAVTANVLDLKDALKIIHLRGILLEELADPGAMLVLKATEETVTDLLTSGLTISAYNSPTSVSVAGSTAEIVAFQRLLTELGVSFHRVRYGAASHCSLVEPILDKFDAVMSKIKVSHATVEWYSTMSATKQENFTSNYWREQFRLPVQFGKTINQIAASSTCTFVEIGPQNGLCALVGSTENQNCFVSLGQHAKDDTPEEDSVFKAICTLWALGSHVNLHVVAEHLLHFNADLPNSPPVFVNPDVSVGECNVKYIVTRVWRQYLNVDDHDGNFYTLGGHSLLAVRMASELSSLFQFGVPPTLLLANPTIPSLSEAIIGLGKKNQVDVQAIAEVWKQVIELEEAP